MDINVSFLETFINMQQLLWILLLNKASSKDNYCIEYVAYKIKSMQKYC